MSRIRREFTPVLALSGVYLTVLLLGLLVGHNLITSEEFTPIFSEPESLSSTGILFLNILLATAVMLLLLKYGLHLIIKILVFIAVYSGLFITLSTLLGGLGFIAATLLILLFLFKRNWLTIDLTLIFTIPGVGAMLGASLGVKPALALLLLLSAYDFIAVFGTKHMVTLARETAGKIPFIFLIPFRKETLGLGTGDLALPLVFTVAVLREHTPLHALTTTFGGLLGVLWLTHYITSKKKGTTLPALPPIAAGVLIGYGISLLF